MLTTKTTVLLLLFIPALRTTGQELTANFRAVVTKACLPAVIQFESLSAGNITKWEWDFGNGNTSFQAKPQTTYLQPGSFTIKLIVTDNRQRRDTLVKEAYIQVLQGPQVSFSANKTSGCGPLPVAFRSDVIADSAKKIVQWEWDFGDGEKSTAPAPVHTYQQSGVYSVNLKTSDDQGCTAQASKPGLININGRLSPSFSVDGPSACAAPARIRFTNSTSGPGSLAYQWHFGDGRTSSEKDPGHAYESGGAFSVKLVVISTAGCSDTAEKKIAVSSPTFKPAIGIEGTACMGTAIRFSNHSVPAPDNATWIFPDGWTTTERSPSKIFNAAGTYQVRLVNVYGGCTDTLVQQITVHALPSVDFSSRDTVKCTPVLNARFRSPGTDSYSWDFGDSTHSSVPNPTHAYTRSGSYTVSLTATSRQGCTATLTKPDFIRIRPPAIQLSESESGGCLPYTYRPTLVVSGSDRLVSYKWVFGNGQTSTAAKPRTVFRRQGHYDVTVTVKTITGCTLSQTFKNAVRTGSRPKAAFTTASLEACAGTTVSFTNQSVNAERYEWRFGDGGTSKAQHPQHRYARPGAMDITLIAFNNGCTDTVVKAKHLRINPPFSQFSIKANCANPFEFTFLDGSVGAQSWLWDFGDGTTADGKVPGTHLYEKAGAYTVTLTTTNGACTNRHTIRLWAGPIKLDFEASQKTACKPANISFTPVNAELSPVARLRWVFSNDATTITQESRTDGLQTRFARSGFYDVKMVAIDVFGCLRDSVVKQNYIRINGPEAGFSAPDNKICAGTPMFFADTSKTDGVNPIVQWEWNVGNGAVSKVFTAPPFGFSFDSAGAFGVGLKITDAAGCTSVVQQPKLVHVSAIKAGWEAPVQTCPGAPVQFTNRTIGKVLHALWYFGDGDSATSLSPQHRFRDTGLFSVQLKVTSTDGCRDSLLKPAHIYSGLPKANFDAPSLVTYCVPHEARFQNKSTYYSGQTWNLGHSISTQQNPTVWYRESGDYTISLTVTSPGGCTDSLSKILRIKKPPDGGLVYQHQRQCLPLRVEFSAFDESAGRYVWDFGDGTVIDTTTNKLTHIYQDFGSFVPKVVLYEPSGCFVTALGADTIVSVGVRARFSLNNALFCDNAKVIIADSTSSNDNNLQYRWDFGDGMSPTSLPAPEHQYIQSGRFTVKLTVTTSAGCADSTSKGVTVSERPQISILGDTTICAGQRSTYTALLHNSPGNDVSWYWRLPDGTGTSLRQMPPILFRDSGSFFMQVVATNIDGCADTAYKRIRVHSMPRVAAPPPQSVFSGQKLPLSMSYSGGIRNFKWVPTQGLSCANCPQPEAAPRTPTLYRVVVTDSNGCRNTGEVRINVTCNSSDVFAPNTFSPNGDGRNDVFYIRGSGLDQVRLLRIFNRWGEVVFEKKAFAANDAGVGWDGRHKGAIAEADIYVYQAEAYCSTGELIRFDGNVALIR